MSINVGSMFAGIGGIDLAFANAGCDIIWANEIDKYACETYKLNFKNEIINDDICNIDDFPNFDILTAGFPCQPFSSVGRLGGFDDPRGNLFFQILRVVKKTNPKVIFLENVANITKHDNGNTFRIIKECLNEIGYYVIYQIMNAKEYGNIPQQRNRIYIIAYKNNFKNFCFPYQIPLTKSAFDFFEKNKVDSKYYMDGHKKWDMMINYMSDKRRIYRFTDWGISCGMKDICPTLLAAMGSRFERIPFFYDDYSIRLMTPRECARIQGFPDSFVLPDIDEKQIYKQIGNSVAVPVVYRIAKNICESLKNGEYNEEI